MPKMGNIFGFGRNSNTLSVAYTEASQSDLRNFIQTLTMCCRQTLPCSKSMSIVRATIEIFKVDQLGGLADYQFRGSQ